MPWKGPVVFGGAGRRPLHGWPPETTVSLQTSFFIPSFASTQGPPVSLQPGEAAMASSSPLRSASAAANRKAFFHSGVMKASRWGTMGGVVRAASKFWRPPIPARFIQAMSLAMPSSVMLPFIQCHQTRGRALVGGSLNWASRAASWAVAWGLGGSATTRAAAAKVDCSACRNVTSVMRSSPRVNPRSGLDGTFCGERRPVKRR